MRILVICPSGAVESAIRRMVQSGDGVQNLTIVSGAPLDIEPRNSVEELRLAVPRNDVTARWTRRLGATALGRNALRLTPLDGGRRFAAAFRRRTDTRLAAAQADLIVVLERDGILAGWQAAHRWAAPATGVVFGLPAAESVIAGG